MVAAKNMVAVAVNNTRPKNYRTIRVESTRLSWASFLSLGAAVMLLHNILGGGVDAQACSYVGTEYNCNSQSFAAIPTLPRITTIAW